jgi:tripartite-type tricarboxylate transporter receptor subunit TctC
MIIDPVDKIISIYIAFGWAEKSCGFHILQNKLCRFRYWLIGVHMSFHFFNNFKKIFLFLISAGVIFYANAQSIQQNNRPIKLIVGYLPGGPVDICARIFAPAFSKILGEPVIVENRAGANGAIAANYVSKNDDEKVLFFAGSPTLTISPHVMESYPFDPIQGLSSVAPLLNADNLLIVSSKSAFMDVSSLVAYAKKHPGELTYGSAGVGASNHLSGVLFANRANIQLRHIPFKGSSAAMLEVIGGRISMMFDATGSAKNYIEQGQSRPLAVTAKERNSSFPNVPTMKELGIDMEVKSWLALFGPAKMSEDAIARYNSAAQKALSDKKLKGAFLAQGYDIWKGDAKKLTTQLLQDYKMWGTIAKSEVNISDKN